MNKLGDMCVYPVATGERVAEYGMTLHQHYAGLMMASIVGQYNGINRHDATEKAIAYADALIAGLEKRS